MMYLQDDVVQADEVLGTRSSLLVRLGLLQLGLQSVGHALVPLHQRAQLDVGQVAGGQRQFDYHGEKNKYSSCFCSV